MLELYQNYYTTYAPLYQLYNTVFPCGSLTQRFEVCETCWNYLHYYTILYQLGFFSSRITYAATFFMGLLICSLIPFGFAYLQFYPFLDLRYLGEVILYLKISL